ncbi:GGDEF domain-containing protein [Marinobacter caseinilyticus]|uniref:GGDEF domain-containing protein n=1 Tax=Marinobacter caseinilyticus TaxID=2692195 RepID=UPI00140C4DA1|nr:GGDEF domain-containing protein [Marinobacter caseinilyticus]
MTQLTRARYQSAEEQEEVRVTRVLTWLSFMALLFLIGIGAKSLYSEHTIHGYVLWSFAGLVLVNLLTYWRTGNRKLNKIGMVSIVAALFAYLIASGGESNTGPLWLYVFPPLLFYLTDLKTGTALIVGCLTFAATVFHFPELPFVAAEYNIDFKIRFFATIVFESVFCFVLEASRRNARNELVDLAIMHEQAARTDDLTRLSNRRDMQHRLTMEFSRYQRSGHHFSVVLVDLDLFKRVNDSYGHDAGDTVLRQFSELMQTVVRQTDIPARWGGEEFLILLPDTSLLQALTLAERLRDEVEHTPFMFDGQRLPVTISAGVCSITQSESVNQLLRQVDINLYEAKQNGRNQIAPRVKSRSNRPEAPSCT